MKQPTAPSAVWVAMAPLILILVGWFALDTLIMRVGPVEMRFHFYELAAIIDEPTRLLTGHNVTGTFLTISFSMTCLVTLAVALAPRFARGRIVRLAPCAPLALMLTCGAILFQETNHLTFAAAHDASDVTHALVNLANVLFHQPASIATRHIAIGAGAWLSGAAALYLAVTPLRKQRHE